MDKITAAQLAAIMPKTAPRAAALADMLNDTMAEFSINTTARITAFLATVAHESGQLTQFSEGLNYSAEGLLKNFKNYFTPEQATQYAKQPERIANRIYANRMGNGNEASGDGWRYRGAGSIQLTGADNQKACARYFGISNNSIGDWLRVTPGAIRSAGWFWMINNVNRYADANDFDGVSDVVNRGKKTAAIGDSIGWPERLAFYNTAKKVLV